MRPIDADSIHYVEIGKGIEIALASDVDKLPTLSPDDVRGVVHCKDCKWCHVGYCEKYDDLIPYCAECYKNMMDEDLRRLSANCGLMIDFGDLPVIVPASEEATNDPKP